MKETTRNDRGSRVKGKSNNGDKSNKEGGAPGGRISALRAPGGRISE